MESLRQRKTHRKFHSLNNLKSKVKQRRSHRTKLLHIPQSFYRNRLVSISNQKTGTDLSLNAISVSTANIDFAVLHSSPTNLKVEKALMLTAYFPDMQVIKVKTDNIHQSSITTARLVSSRYINVPSPTLQSLA